MNILFLRGFNNYFNRVVKKYSTLDDYRGESSSYLDLGNINFNPNDGVATELIVGNENQIENSKPLDWENIGTPDYAICYEMVESNPVIRSRWFVLESERTRTGQYRLALKRDVLAEHYEHFMSAPCFVEKGIINDVNNPLLYNNENMTYNQIKRKPEILLKDQTDCGWIIGYVSSDGNRYPATGYHTSTARIEETGNIIDYEDIDDQFILGLLNGEEFIFDDGYSLNNLNQSEINYWNYPTRSVNTDNKIEFNLYMNTTSSEKFAKMVYSNYCSAYYTLNSQLDIDYIWHSSTDEQLFKDSNVSCYQTRETFSSSSGYIYKFTSTSDYHGLNTIPNDSFYNSTSFDPFHFGYDIYDFTVKRLLDYINNKNFKASYFNSLYNKRYISGYELNNMKNFINQYDYVKRGDRLYKITPIENVITESNNNVYYSIKIQDYITPTTRMSNALNKALRSGVPLCRFRGLSNAERFASLGESPVFSSNREVMKWTYTKFKKGRFILTGVESTQIKTYIPAERQQCYDSSIDIFAIPYSDTFTFKNGKLSIIMGKQVALQAAVALGKAKDNVYDIQLLPYFPDRSLVSDYYIHNNQIDISFLTEHIDYETILNNSDKAIGYYFWSRTNSGSFNIYSELSLSNISSPLARKISNETEVYRLCSPNFNGQFEFSLAKSNGLVEFFNVDYTYKPYNPYIHVTPALTGLYGSDYVELDDARGLICGGDFSLTRYTSAWEQYQLNNKNYQEIFDRQIKNMDVNNQIALEQQQFNAIAGSITGGFSGAIGGAVAGSKAGPYGAIAGAAVGLIGGAALSAFGAEKDRDWLERQQKENKSYAIDMYGYKLGNIQALPYSLAKTSAFTANNRIFPFVEFYSCTSEEINNLTNKIKYDGMTIMATSTLNSFSNSNDFDRIFLKGQLIKLDNLDDDFHIADAIYEEVNKGFYLIPGMED